MRNKYVLIAGIICLFIFYLFSREVKQGFLKQTDFNTTVKIQERIDKSSRLRLTSIIGNVMEGSTFFASPEASVVIVLILFSFAFYDWKQKKIRWESILILVLFTLLVGGEIYGKSVVHHPSPPFFMIKNPTTVFPKYYINESFSYPSGHAARAVFIGFVLYSIVWIKKLKMCMLLGILGYILLVSVSRIYLGHHWLSDIIGGALLGSGFGLLAQLHGLSTQNKPTSIYTNTEK